MTAAHGVRRLWSEVAGRERRMPDRRRGKGYRTRELVDQRAGWPRDAVVA